MYVNMFVYMLISIYVRIHQEDDVGLGFESRSDDSNESSLNIYNKVIDNYTPVASITIKSLIVHLPSDHLRKMEVAASSQWTLAEVFSRMVSTGKLSHSPSNQHSSSYIFLYWPAGKLGPQKVPHPPQEEHDLFGIYVYIYMYMYVYKYTKYTYVYIWLHIYHLFHNNPDLCLYTVMYICSYTY
jgi:hypothetical protein